MLNRSAKIAFFVLIPVLAFADPKEKGATKVQVVTARTQIHGSSSGNMFSYTNLMFTQVDGKKLVYECAQTGDVCPVLESGQTYTANRDGAYIYITMTPPEGKKDISVKFKQVGSW
ncbi:MAG TPA: hypothetical protein VNY09_09650 [Candidatus Sulfotelmatobacter sp.]|jgi:hypothetical protein|nr:hypothetical protein [Candidatus Sulfotelmatobacter sp.]